MTMGDRRGVLVALAVLVAGCAASPSAGPPTTSVRPAGGRAAVVPIEVEHATAAAPPDPPPAAFDRERVLVVGDSLAHGAFDAPGIVDALVALRPDLEVVALGGSTTSPMDGYAPDARWSDWAGQVHHWLAAGFDADVLVIQGCCNDYRSDERWRGALDALVAAGRADDPGGDRRIVVVTSPRLVPGTAPFYEPYGVGKMIRRTNEVLRTYPGVAVADVDAAFAVDGDPVWDVPGVGVVRYVDGLHLSDAGAMAAASLVLAAMT